MTRKGDNGATAAAGSGGLSDPDKVVGRYAYVIYDEGGLLDLNVAGYPSTGSGALWNADRDPAFKGAAAFADLTRIPGITQANVDDLVNWRNPASLASPGYRAYVASNTTGFLRTANTGLSGSGETDHLFAGRQQMISLLVDKLGWNPDTLQYFTSFSRDINQPSLAPRHSTSLTSAGAGTLPLIQTRAKGGNNQIPDGASGATAKDIYDKVNPQFLGVRVQNAFTRADGSHAVEGEPLVKQRFALNRLIWLTYRGPSHGVTGDDIDDLKTNLGVKTDWLDQGTEDNIRKYFGLEWETNNNCWRYNLHLNASGEIKTLAEVAQGTPGDPPRDPDFFEILKASITAGALGKAGTVYSKSNPLQEPSALQPPGGGFRSLNNALLYPTYYQYRRDSSLDYQIMQIGANMIDQSDVDGFPTHIRFGQDNIENIEFRGIENLPYLYRVRNSVYITSMNGGGSFYLVQQPENLESPFL